MEFNVKHFSRFLTLAIVFISNNYFCLGQHKNSDSLQYKTINELFNLYENSDIKNDQIKYIKAFVRIAKKEKKETQTIAGYYILSGLYQDSTSLIYSDSIISITSQNETKYHPALAYQSKAIFYHEKGELEKAIDNYLIANKYAKKNNNTNLLVTTNYSIGTIKRKVGEYKEALKLYKENIPYSKKVLADSKKSNYYLTTLLAISNIFYEMKVIDSASYYNNLGVRESIKYNDVAKYHRFSSNQGIVNYLKGKYDIAIDSLNKHYSYFKKSNDHGNCLYSNFYLGKSYLAKKKNLIAVDYFKKVDSLYQITKSVSPITRESYEFLVNHYKNTNDLKKQLFYINKLMSYDSIVYKKQNYLSKQIFKEYDIPKLNSEKESILQKMEENESKSKIIVSSILTILLITILVLIYQYNKRKLYKKRFNEILNTTAKETNIGTKEVNIPKTIIDSVLNGLDTFEKTQRYISNTITLHSLAKELETNSNYLSKIINHYKGSSFSNYISSLRIDYIINELKQNSTFRKFTIKAIAEEAGFNNSESFSKAFYKIKGIKPSYFIKELEKIHPEN